MQKFTQQKDLGNQQFKNKNYQSAIKIFIATAEQIQKIQTKEYLIPTAQLGKLYVILLINAAFACINLRKKQNYQKAIQLSTKALSVDPKNVKALFRRGVARKQYAQILQRQFGANYKNLLQMYTKAKQDFEQVNILEKSNDLALQKFKQTVKDIYRVTKAQGQQINLTGGSKSSQQNLTNESVKSKISSSTPYQGNHKKKGVDMSKIMQQYKVNQVSQMAQKKVQQTYLTTSLPSTRAQLQKAIRQIQKSKQSFLKFVYRFNQQYLTKIQPTFDMLSQIIEVVLNYGKGDDARDGLIVCRKCKSFGLYWKSLVKRQKEQFKKKWMEFGLEDDLE